MKSRNAIERSLEREHIYTKGNTRKARHAGASQDSENINIEGDGDCTVFSIRENIVKKDKSVQQNRFPKQQSHGRPKKINNVLNQISNMDINRSDYHTSFNNNSGTTTPYKGNSSFSLVQDGTNTGALNELTGVAAGQKRHERVKSISDKPEHGPQQRYRALNAGYMGDGPIDGLGDEEPAFPTIVHKREGQGSQIEVIAERKLDVEKSHECLGKNRCLCGVSKPKLNSNLPAYRIKKEKEQQSNSSMRIVDGRMSIGDYLAAQENDKITKKDHNPVIRHMVMYSSNNSENVDVTFHEGGDVSEPRNVRNSRRTNSKPARAKSHSRNPKEQFPKLNMKELEPESLKMNIVHNRNLSSTNKQYLLKSKYNDHLDKRPVKSPTSRLDAIVPVRRVSDIYKKQFAENGRVQGLHNVSMDNGKAKNPRIVSNLLKPRLNDLKTNQKPNLAGFTKDQLSSQSRAKTNGAIPSARSDHSHDSLHIPTKHIRTPRLKQGNSLLDSNNLVRSLYRVKSGSARSLDYTTISVKSEGDLSNDDMLNSGNGRGLLSSRERDSVNRSHQHRNTSLTSIPIGKRLLEQTFSGQQQGDKIKVDDQLSATQGNSFNSSTKRNRSAIEKFQKDWEGYKKKFEKTNLKDTSLIQFSSNNTAHPLIPRSKGVTFERTEKRSIFSEVKKTPGPGNYHVLPPAKKTGFSFGKNKKLDIFCNKLKTGLPLIEDINKMLDPVRHVTHG